MGLPEIARHLVSPGKGILAADESIPTIGKRLSKYGVENTAENRRAYREIFITADGISGHLSGIILNSETLEQKTAAGKPFLDVLTSSGIYAGIKVDQGLVPLDGCPGESCTSGLENLPSSCKMYARRGAKFTKWRAALSVGGGRPSQKAIEINAEQLAAYAAISQDSGLVPIVEPEILIDGDHTIQVSAEITAKVLETVFEKLLERNVILGACLLKIQMIMPGSRAAKCSAQEIAEHTLQVLSRSVPSELAGIVFLSGGQSEEEATVHLNEIIRVAKAADRDSWGLTFSYGRSLQASVLKIWSKNIHGNREQAKEVAIALAQANASATLGQYEGPHPSVTSGATLTENFRGWCGAVPCGSTSDPT